MWRNGDLHSSRKISSSADQHSTISLPNMKPTLRGILNVFLQKYIAAIKYSAPFPLVVWQPPFLFILTVPPRLGALSFPENTRFGIRTQVTCFVQEGDLPIEIHWQKDGQRLQASRNIRMTKVDDHTTILVINKAYSNHSGNYSCVASNAAKTVSSSAFLSVNGNPKILWLLVYSRFWPFFAVE